MATPLTTRDENGISGRDWMDRAKEEVGNYKHFSQNPDELPSRRTLESYRQDARHAIADAWQHPEAAKAMQAVGLSERGMQDDLNAGKVAKVTEGLSAPDPAGKTAAATTQAQRDLARQQVSTPAQLPAQQVAQSASQRQQAAPRGSVPTL